MDKGSIIIFLKFLMKSMSFYYFLLGVLLRNSCGDFKAGILGENGFCRP
jgi:hypothetical protein